MNFYCINLASATERWKQVSARFEQEGIHVTRFNGWNNSIGGLRATFPYEIDAPGSGYLMKETSVGIYLSHWMLWNYLAAQAGDWFFIFEDDASFVPGWKEMWQKDLALLPADWDLFYVGSCCVNGWPENVQFSETIIKTQKVQCLHAYMVRAKALPMMLEKTQKVWAPIDLALLWECQPHLNVFARIPRLVNQENTELPP